MPNTRKIKAFEFLVLKFSDWYKHVNPNGDFTNDFTKLKLIKLLFFASAVDANEKEKGLLEVFDNYWAMPFGHVESDIYNEIGHSTIFNISKNGLEVKETPPIDYFDEIADLTERLENSIEKLKEINDQLVIYPPFDLVEISHQWQSWQTVFNLAKQQKKLSLKIPNFMIQVEPKIFHLEIES